MTESEGVAEFGERVPGAHYVRRPGCYGLAFDEANRVGLVRTRAGYFIPGGGADAGEAAEETLAREVREECGRAVEIVRRIGVAVQYVFAEGEGCFAKDCTFFEVRLGVELNGQSEGDHTLVWLQTDEALERLQHESQRWALERAIQNRGA